MSYFTSASCRWQAPACLHRLSFEQKLTRVPTTLFVACILTSQPRMPTGPYQYVRNISEAASPFVLDI
jgi:hypothetical protein